MKQEKVRDTLSRLSKGLFRILSETTVHSIATIILDHPANQLVQIESEDTNGLEKKKKKETKIYEKKKQVWQNYNIILWRIEKRMTFVRIVKVEATNGVVGQFTFEKVNDSSRGKKSLETQRHER